MRAPAFWQGANLLSDILMPLGDLYAAGGWLRQRLAAPKRVGVPVICIGNLVAGGAGKTPTVLAVLAKLRARGLRPAALLRGYGGRLTGPIQVDPGVHNTGTVGDEALLLARAAPTWVARDRAAGARAAADHADVIVMDDGFQNPSLAKDLSLLVVDGASGFGNGRLIPAGPLREPVARGLARADALVLVGRDRQDTARRAAGKPVLRASLQAHGGGGLKGRRLIAFAGIGRPAKFFETLQDLEADLIGTAEFADHHPYTSGDLAPLVAKAERAGASLITTEKDALRLPQALSAAIEVLPVELVFARPTALDGLLDELFGGLRGKAGASADG
ncbi:tetraacyldisaccharide 4'-kinase [Algihabitans albus]|uniref:tetraacyldisaccharide 4'-kinase n=1 Tax=Algihabitans albus TaxID=2164067 RepID=UPI000E5D6632|nr:tetraacyldisaccharide 4'-kinase [Algihabitans albus]